MNLGLRGEGLGNRLGVWDLIDAHYFFFFLPHCMTRGIFSSRPRVKSRPLTVSSESNHWTGTEFPRLLYLKSTIKKDLLYNTGNSAQYSVIT